MTYKQQLRRSWLAAGWWIVLLKSVDLTADLMLTVAKTSTNDFLCATDTPNKVVFVNKHSSLPAEVVFQE